MSHTDRLGTSRARVAMLKAKLKLIPKFKINMMAIPSTPQNNANFGTSADTEATDRATEERVTWRTSKGMPKNFPTMGVKPKHIPSAILPPIGPIWCRNISANLWQRFFPKREMRSGLSEMAFGNFRQTTQFSTHPVVIPDDHKIIPVQMAKGMVKVVRGLSEWTT